jgi:Flp pilus assembly pilin Flp
MPDCRTIVTRLAMPVVQMMHDRRGAVALEYGLLVAMIAVALVGILTMSGVSDSQTDTYGRLSDAMSP